MHVKCAENKRDCLQEQCFMEIIMFAAHMDAQMSKVTTEFILKDAHITQNTTYESTVKVLVRVFMVNTVTQVKHSIILLLMSLRCWQIDTH